MLARLARSARVTASPALRLAQRHMAMGPAVGGQVSDETLEKLSKLSSQALVDGLWVMGWPTAMIEGARGLQPGQKCAGMSDCASSPPTLQSEQSVRRLRDCQKDRREWQSRQRHGTSVSSTPCAKPASQL